MRVIRAVSTAIFLLAAIGCANEPVPGDTGSGDSDSDTDTDSNSDSDDTGIQTEPDPFEQAEAIGRGINMGNFLEGPTEGEWNSGRLIEQGDFGIIKAAGFDSVRIPIRWSSHTYSEAPYEIIPSFMDRVEEVVGWALDEDLVVIIDVHHYDSIQTDTAGQKPKFLAIWKQIAQAFIEAPKSLYYELLNEPTDAMNVTAWNELIVETIDEVRAIDPFRTLVVGPVWWNNATYLNTLLLPEEDRNIIVTFHMYDPFDFTHSGAEWMDPIPAEGAVWDNNNTQDTASVDSALELAASWSDSNNRPMFLGEFGSYHKADQVSRIRYTNYVVSRLAELDITWTYWEFCAGFGAYDPNAMSWYDDLLDALIH